MAYKPLGKFLELFSSLFVLAHNAYLHGIVENLWRMCAKHIVELPQNALPVGVEPERSASAVTHNTDGSMLLVVALATTRGVHALSLVTLQAE